MIHTRNRYKQAKVNEQKHTGYNKKKSNYEWWLKVNAVNIYDQSLPKFDYITKYVFENMYGYIKPLLHNSLYTHFNHCKQNKSYSMIIYTKTHSNEHSSVSKCFTLLPDKIILNKEEDMFCYQLQCIWPSNVQQY